MPAILDHVLISGEGQADFTPGQRILYILYQSEFTPETVSRGPTLDKVIRYGFFSVGSQQFVDEGIEVHWKRPIWVEFTNFWWAPSPAVDAGGSSLSDFMDSFRWWLTPGASGRLTVGVS